MTGVWKGERTGKRARLEKEAWFGNGGRVGKIA